MFNVIYTDKDTEHLLTVYDVSYDSSGYPLFLIYFNYQWIRKSAKYFKPVQSLLGQGWVSNTR